MNIGQTSSGSVYIAWNIVILPSFLQWKFCGKAQIPQSFGQIVQNSTKTVAFWLNNSILRSIRFNNLHNSMLLVGCVIVHDLLLACKHLICNKELKYYNSGQKIKTKWRYQTKSDRDRKFWYLFLLHFSPVPPKFYFWKGD